MNFRPLPRPFLKWAGGKAQMLNELIGRAPSAFNTYYEPFVGGGALFFRLYREKRLGQACLSEINAELVDTYLAVRDHVEAVIALLAEYPHDKTFYYDLRAQDPQQVDLPRRAARMIYLNKTGYNGLYRVNRKGQFNVPFGRYKSPQYCDAENLRAVSMALQNVDIRCESFESVLDRAQAGDLIYFDPPYAPRSKTANFTAYHADGFGDEDQARLRDVCVELTRRDVRAIVSNSSTELIRTLYARSEFTEFEISEVFANRAINSNARRRGKLPELIITNYPIGLMAAESQRRHPDPPPAIHLFI
ncbi:MAG: DNA adenine methylase [Anaerolineae bacterium]|nr:DNA adenine methylase [Anaerolineae bacterium]